MSFFFPVKPSPIIAALLLAGAAALAGPAEELVKRGDAFDTQLKAAQALEVYIPALKLQPNNASIMVRMARQYRHLMSDAAAPDEQFRLGGIATAYARRAVAIAPNKSETQLALAISDAKMLPLMSSKEQVAASRRIKKAADKAIALDPSNDLAWHVLGRWHLKLAELSGVKRALATIVYGELPTTTYAAAAKCFEKAIELNPTRLMHYIELGRTYAQMGRAIEARRCLYKGLAMPNVEKDDPETKIRGNEALAKLP